MALTGLPRPHFSVRDTTKSSAMGESDAAFASFVGSALFAGFAGVELQDASSGKGVDVGAVQRILNSSRVALSSVDFFAEWHGSSESDSERANATRAIEFVSSFPGARLVLNQLPGADRRDLRQRQDNALGCVSEIARRASNAGVLVTFHPTSGEGSAFGCEADYDRFFSGTNLVGYTPDLREIAQSRMDPLDVVHTYRDRIDHVRLGVGRDSTAASHSDGEVDRARVVAYLCHTGFTGWFVLDADSTAGSEPSAIDIQSAGRYAQGRLRPLVEGAQRARGSS